MLLPIRPIFSRQVRALNSTTSRPLSNSSKDRLYVFLDNFIKSLVNGFTRPSTHLGMISDIKAPIPICSLDTLPKQIAFIQLSLAAVQLDTLDEPQQLKLAHIVMMLSIEQMPKDCIRPFQGRVQTATTLSEPIEAVFKKGFLFEKGKELDANIFNYISQSSIIGDDRVIGSQPVFRGTSEAHLRPKFDGNVIVEFSPNPKLGISISALLDACLSDPHKYVKQFGHLLGTDNPIEFSRMLKTIKTHIGGECEIAVARPIPACCLYSITPTTLADRGHTKGQPVFNTNYAPEKFLYPTNLKDCITLARDANIFV